VVVTVLSKTRGPHSGGYENCHLLAYLSIEYGRIVTSIQRHVLHSNTDFYIFINGLFSDAESSLTEEDNKIMNEFEMMPN
jgi:hypothetical protein